MRKQPWNYDIGGKVLKFSSSDKLDYVLMDPTLAYPGVEMKGWRRHVTLDKPSVTVVVDEVKAAPGSEIELRFHRGVSSEPKGNFVMLNGNKGKMALIPVTDQSFKFREGKHACQPVNATRSFFWVNYFGTVINTKKENTVVATIILPVNDENEARKISGSVKKTYGADGSFVLSFTAAGRQFRYFYVNNGTGILLKN